MFRPSVVMIAMSVVAIQAQMLAPAMAFERVQIDPAEILVHVDSQDVEQARSDGPDGSRLIAGHRGARPGCPGVQAYARKMNTDGSLAWELNAAADKDCDVDGQPDGGGAPMFADIIGLDHDYILSSTIHDVLHGPDGSAYLTGQLLVGWEDAGVLTAVWSAFVLYRGPLGQHVADLYVGPQPTGTPAQTLDCLALCSALGESELTQWGGRALATLKNPSSPANGLVLAGWRWSVDELSGGHKDVFFVALDWSLETARWLNILPHPGADLPLDIAVAENGNVYATGYYGPAHDVFVACFDGIDGTLTQVFVGGGAFDDWSDQLKITEAGEIEIKGKFTKSATFGDVTLQGTGPTGFRALLTPDLELILAELLDGGPNGGGTGEQQTSSSLKGVMGQNLPTELPTVPPSGTQGSVPTFVDVIVGFAGSTTDPALVGKSDNEYLVLYGDEQPDHHKTEVLFEVPIVPGASILKSVVLEFKSTYCTDLDILLGGGDAPTNVYYDIGGAEVCPLEEPVITIEIPTNIAEENLGFSASSQSEAALEVRMGMDIYGHPPELAACGGEIACGSPADDEQIDELMINSEFPNE